GVAYDQIRWPEYSEQRIRWILTRLAADPPDVFVPNLMVPAYYASRWVRAAGVPTVGVLHSDDAFHRALLWVFVFGRPPYCLSALVCVSRFLEQSVQAQRPPETVVWRLPCGTPLAQQLTHAPRESLRIAYVGRLVEEQKRITDVTRALCRAV